MKPDRNVEATMLSRKNKKIGGNFAVENPAGM